MRRLCLVLLVVALGVGGAACDSQKSESDNTEQQKANAEADQKQEESTAKTDDSPGGEDPSAASDQNSADDESGDENSADEGPDQALLKPSEADKKAPKQFKVRFETTAGEFVTQFHRDWAPKGADRVYNLVKLDFYDDVAFFRVVEGFMAQFGLHGEPEVNKAWLKAPIEADPSKKSNKRGYITFAERKQPNSRTAQL